MLQLNEETTASVRPKRPISILQFGSGNFLRAFVDWMIQQSNNAQLTNHGVAVAYATDRPERVDPLVPQDGLYHVCLEGIKNSEPVREITMVDVIDQIVDPYRQWNDFQQIVTSPDLKIVVSNTTEAGIVFVDESLDACPPQSFPAQIARLLHDRFIHFDGSATAGLAIVPCELIEDNGQQLKNMVIRHAEAANWEPEFIEWVETSNHFYDTLVDRIVAGFPKDDAAQLFDLIGYEDQGLVKGEYFSLWAIGGDDYLKSILPLDQLDLGTTFFPVEEIRPFRDKKVRILNGAHTALAQAGILFGHQTVKEGFSDPQLHDYIQKMVREEVIPTIEEDPVLLNEFADSILERFNNPYLNHQLKDIGLNSLSKWKSRNLPVVLDSWREGRRARRSELVLANLLLLYSGSVDTPYEPQDEPGVVDFIKETFDRSNLKEWVSQVVRAYDLAGDSEAETAQLIEITAENVKQLIDKGLSQVIEEI